MRSLTILTKEEMDQIHSAVLRVLERTGCRLEDDQCLKILESVGAEVDYRTKIAKVPSYIVEESIKKCDKKFRLYGTDPKRDVTLGDGEVYAHQSEGGTYVVDLDTSEIRTPKMKDVEMFIRIADSLDGVNPVICPVIPDDVPPSIRGLRMSRALLEYTGKPCSAGGVTMRSMKYIREMAEVVAGGYEELRKRPMWIICSDFGGATSPLVFQKDKLVLFREAASQGFPCMVISMPSAGGTAPVTLAGAIVIQTAEDLMGIVLGQAIRPGLSMSVGIRVGLMDLRFGVFTCGAPEYGLVQAATTQLFKQLYGFSVDAGWSVSDSKILDEQVGYEKAFTWLLCVMTGADMVSGMGAIEFGLTQSCAQLVIDNELLNMVRRVHRGVGIDMERLATELIDKVGIGGNFVGERFTLKHIKTEQMMPKVSDRRPRRRWEERGRKDIVERAREIAKRLIREHESEYLSKDVRGRLDTIVKKAEKELLDSID